jgi:hypothetical protein
MGSDGLLREILLCCMGILSALGSRMGVWWVLGIGVAGGLWYVRD